MSEAPHNNKNLSNTQPRKKAAVSKIFLPHLYSLCLKKNTVKTYPSTTSRKDEQKCGLSLPS